MPELNIVEKVIALEAVELFQNLSPDQLSRIASVAKEVGFLPGQVVLSPGKELDALYVVLDGGVSLARQEEELYVAHASDVLGTWALFDAEPLDLTATAVEDTRLLRISRDDFYDLLSDNTEITAAIFAQIVKRFRKLVEQ